MTRSILPDQLRPKPATAPPDRPAAGGAAPALRWLRERPARLALAVVLVLAGLAQLRIWATGRGFWGDELAIAINLRERGFLELADDLLYYQVAPVGWLVAGKAMLVGVGPDERVLRLPSLVAGLVVLGLVALIADRAIGRWSAVAAVGLVGITPSILYYAGELKQYEVEAAAGLGLLVAGAALTRARVPGRVLAGAAVVAVVAVAVAYSALVVLGGVLAGVVSYLAARRRWRAALTSLLMLAPAGLVGAGLVLHRRSLRFHPSQENVFETGFPEAGGGAGAVLDWLPAMWSGLTEYPLGWRQPVWTLLLVVAGLVTLAVRGRWQWAAMLAGILVAALGAGAVRGLPLADRVALYLVPVIVLLLVAGLAGVVWGIGWLARRTPASEPVRLGPTELRPARPRRAWPVVAVAAAVVLATLAGPPVQAGFAELRDPTVRDTSREALWTVAERRQPGDVVALYYFSHKAVRWYGERVGIPEVALLRLVPDDSPDCRPERLDELLAGAGRVWYADGARRSADPGDYHLRVAEQLASRGSIVELHRYHRGSGGWLLVDLTAGPDPNPPAVAPDPAYGCLTVAD